MYFLPHYLNLTLNFPEQQFSSVSVPVEHLRLGVSVFVDDELIMSEILFLMSCMRCNVELNTLRCLIFKCFLSEFKCVCLLAPSSFTSSHPMR